jgi:hypothetical protein
MNVLNLRKNEIKKNLNTFLKIKKHIVYLRCLIN